MKKINYDLGVRTPMTTDQMVAELKKIESDERIWYSAADVFINAPLALIQIELTARAMMIRKILGMQLITYHKK